MVKIHLPLLSFKEKILIGIFFLCLGILLWQSFYLFSTVSLRPKTLKHSYKLENTKVLTLPSRNLKASPSVIAQNHGSTSSAQASQLYLQPSGRELYVPILMYHYIGNNPNPADKERYALSVTPDNFTAQMKYLADNHYSTITLDTLYPALEGKISLPPKPVIITFDDGYEDLFYNAFPILLQYHLRATSFIPTGLINQGYYLTWTQIKQMQKSGLITFEAHSVHHYQLTSLSGSALKEEIVGSKEQLEQELGVPVNFFAYPYGTYNSRVVQALKNAGFVGAAGTWASKIQSEGTLFDMPRMRVSGYTSFNEFVSLL